VARAGGHLPIAVCAISRHHGDIVIPQSELDSDRLVRVPIGFPEDLYEWLRETAHRRRVPMAQVVREALNDYRQRDEPQMALWRAAAANDR
jgi:hypothetical protein